MKNLTLVLFLTGLLLSNCSKDNKQEESCPEPNFGVSVNNNEVQINPTNWDYGFFEMEFGANGYSQGNGTTTNNLYIGAMPNGTYDVYLRGNCGGNDWSGWTGPKSFIVQGTGGGGGGSATCNTPDNFNSNPGFACQYDVYFNDGNSFPDEANYFQIEYGPSGFTQGTGTIDQTNFASYSKGSYAANTTYDFYARANCGGNDWSSWSDVYSFYIDKNYQMCAGPTAINAYRNGSLIYWELNGNGECEFEVSLSTCVNTPCNGDNIYPESTDSGNFSASFGVTWNFFARSVCKDGSKTAWQYVEVTN